MGKVGTKGLCGASVSGKALNGPGGKGKNKQGGKGCGDPEDWKMEHGVCLKGVGKAIECLGQAGLSLSPQKA